VDEATGTASDGLEARMRAALTVAMKGRDRVAVAALRAALGAIDNAGAVAVEDGPIIADGPIAGARTGLGTGEAARRALTADDVARIVAAEAADREQAAAARDRLGRPDDAARLRAEAAVLVAHLGTG
jgi:uncharacterized protein